MISHMNPTANKRRPQLIHRAEPHKHAQEALMLDLLEAVESRLTGRGTQRLIGSPSFSRFCIAALASVRHGDLSGAQHAMEMRNPRRMGARFHVPTAELHQASLEIQFDFRVFFPATPNWEEFLSRRVLPADSAEADQNAKADLPNCEKRLDCEIRRSVRLQEIVEADGNEREYPFSELEQLRLIAARDPELLKIRPSERPNEPVSRRKPTILRSISDAAAYADALRNFGGEPVVPPWSGKMVVTTANIAEGMTEVSVYFENTTQQEEFNSLWKGFFHDCRFELRVVGAHIAPQLLHHMAEQDYRVASHVRATGIHCPVAATDAQVYNLQLPTFVVPEQEHKKRGAGACAFDRLAGPGALGELSRLHEEMLEYARAWRSRFSEVIPDEGRRRDPLIRESFERAVAAFESEAERFAQGIDAMRRDPKALRSFQLANRAIGEANRHKKIVEWRPFQLVFFVSLLKDIVVRENPDIVDGRDCVDVLWFPTGGGKTETYLGLIAFGLIYDRLRGKHRGVTAWVKFPLRMLSLDQLDRFTRVLVLLNDIHAAENIPGEAFEIGYYMGDRNTPNRWHESQEYQKYGLSPSSLVEEFERARRREPTLDPEALSRLVFKTVPERETRRFQLMETCPRVGCERPVYVFPESGKEHLEIRCPQHGRLPVQFVDEEIYRRVPSVIISTIDKLAIIAYNDSIRNLLVRPFARCTTHGYLPSRTCPSCKRLDVPDAEAKVVNVKPDEFYDPAPAIQVQDELHLLKEQLGSYNSHYESLVDHLHDKLLKDGRYKIHNPRGRTKIIGATATISEYEQQIAQLYGRKPRRFPAPGPTRAETFYSIDKPTGRRILAALWPVNMSGVTAMNELYVSYWFRLSELDADRDALRRVLSSHGVDLALVDDEFLTTVLDKASSTVSYYTNKPKAYIGSDHFRQSLPVAAEDYRPDLKKHLVGLESETLTGDSEFREIRRIKTRLENGRIHTPEWLPHLAATSIISHGVDVGRLNFIAFSGMPADTAEYIQASSRVGRSDLGLSIVIHDTARDRDELHFINHHLYHEHQEFHVRGVALNRFSKYLVNRTFPGLVVALIRLFYNPIQLKKEAQYEFTMRDAHGLLEALQDSSVRSALVKILVEFIGRGLTDEAHLQSAIQSVWDNMKKEGLSNKAKGDELWTLFPNFRPLTNHREIETPLAIGLDAESYEFVRGSGWDPNRKWATRKHATVDDAPDEGDAPPVELSNLEKL